jgi:uncharacterized membrane protein
MWMHVVRWCKTLSELIVHTDIVMGLPFPIQIHLLAALAAIVLGGVQLALPKGNQRHRIMGWIWVTLMYVAAISSLFIHMNPWIGPFGPIHLLSLLVIFATPSSVLAARRGKIRHHKLGMVQLFFFGLIVAGSFAALSPGRVLHGMLFGS